MSLARIYSRAQVGINAPEVIVEVHLGTGLPAFHIVGLPEASVKESKDRVRSALENSQFGFPDQRITVNLIIYRKNRYIFIWLILLEKIQ